VLGLSSELVIALKFSLSTGNTEKGYSVIANWDQKNSMKL